MSLCAPVSLAISCAFLAGCTDKAVPPPAPAPQTSRSEAAPAAVGVVAGVVRLEGTPPEMRPMDMASDIKCAAHEPVLDETVIVDADKGLKNVLVWVKSGLVDRVFEPPKTPVRLDQVGCVFVPHVFGVQTGQPVEIMNSDDTAHNVHALARLNDSFNLMQPTRGYLTKRAFYFEEVVPIKCDVHPWMASYAGVFAHPYFAVTATDGRFQVQGIPEGTCTIAVWHEKYGEQTRDVQVKAGETAAIEFTMK